MKSLFIKNAFLEDRLHNILVDGNRFKDVDVPGSVVADEVLDARGKAILPAFYNMHNHAAMTLLRGYADDIALESWLQDYIWPYEASLTAADIRKGSEIAVDEMLRSGTVFFNDMYFEIEETIEVVRKSRIRASIGITMMDSHSKSEYDSKIEFIKHWSDPTGGRISLTIAPHAIYTVGAERLRAAAELARDYGLKLHIHLAETVTEREDSIKRFGLTPVRYLDSLGVLGSNVIAAHCVHVDKEEWDILAERGVTVAHCPCSNMKIGSGRFPFELAIASGVRIALGTDGTCSNNNLDMREEMKFSSFLAKCISAGPEGLVNSGDPTLLPDTEVLKWATENGAAAFGIDAGRIENGKIADFILVDMAAPSMNPCHSIVSNWVYAADSSLVSHVVCDGKILM